MLALVVLGFVPGLLDPFMPFKAAVLRVAGLGMLALTILSWISRSLSGSRRPAGPPRTDFPPGSISLLDVAVTGWCVVAFLSWTTSVSVRLSLFGEIGQREGLLTTLALAGLYSGVRRSHRAIADARVTLDVVVACAVVAAGYGLLQRAGLDPIQWAGRTSYPAGAGRVIRSFSTLGNPILLGAVLAAALSLVVARLASGRTAVASAGPVAVLLAAATLATLSRGAWLAALTGSLAAIAGARLLGDRPSWRRSLVTLGPIAALVAAWGWIALRAPVAARLSEGPEAISGQLRGEIARSAMALWRRHPVLGTGPDTFGLEFPSAQTLAFWSREWAGSPVHAHSVPLQILATGGLLTALSGAGWLAALAIVLARGWRGSPEARPLLVEIGAVCACLVVAGLVNPVGIAGAALFVTCSALVSALEPTRAGAPSGSKPSSWPAALAVGVALAFAIAAAFELPALAAAGRARGLLEHSTREAVASRVPWTEDALRTAAWATRLLPAEDLLWRLRSDAALARAEASFVRGELETARTAAGAALDAGRIAVARVPIRSANLQRVANAWMLEARIARATPRAPAGGRHGGTAASDTSGAAAARHAERAFAGARLLAPVDPLVLVDQARGELSLGRFDSALVTARRIIELYPGSATGHALEAAALMSLGRRAEARASLERALAARWNDVDDGPRRAAEQLLRALEGAGVSP